MIVTTLQLNASNIPRSRWESVRDPEGVKHPELRAIVENLVDHFVSGENFLITGGQYHGRLKALCWIGYQALGVENPYFRSNWDVVKPIAPHVNTSPFTVRYDQVEPLIKLKMGNEEELETWAYRPDIFLLAELGVEFPTGMSKAVVDELLRMRGDAGLITIISFDHDIRDDQNYKESTREILRSYREISLRR